MYMLQRNGEGALRPGSEDAQRRRPSGLRGIPEQSLRNELMQAQQAEALQHYSQVRSNNLQLQQPVDEITGEFSCDRLDGINQTGNGIRWSLFSGKYERLPGEDRQENMRNLRSLFSGKYEWLPGEDRQENMRNLSSRPYEVVYISFVLETQLHLAEKHDVICIL
ncbi:hypothetical protein NDU88_004848 [Pleurodeles waltl]|uniref:Uncharacterized protein n=1 Tax=Pleurodeles waltl TaxID=8319 RepID=A0AAV7UGW3_PLEWA|nr:hypothetical protein NDU88_004848 [Pleurodeles waltl]